MLLTGLNNNVNIYINNHYYCSKKLIRTHIGNIIYNMVGYGNNLLGFHKALAQIKEVLCKHHCTVRHWRNKLQFS